MVSKISFRYSTVNSSMKKKYVVAEKQNGQSHELRLPHVDYFVLTNVGFVTFYIKYLILDTTPLT